MIENENRSKMPEKTDNSAKHMPDQTGMSHSTVKDGRGPERSIFGTGKIKARTGSSGFRKSASPANRMTGEIYYADARISKAVLANEWDKRIYLTAVEEVRDLFQASIFGFCVLDDRVRLLLGGKDVRRQTIRQMLSASFDIFDRNTSLNGENSAIPDGTSIRVNIIRMENEKDALLALRYIHLTPVSERYILCAQDYWWSSYTTYRGHYTWPMLDIRPAMQYFERNDPRALHSLTEFHRQGEAMQNQIPDCIRRGMYEQLSMDKKGILLPGKGEEGPVTLDRKA